MKNIRFLSVVIAIFVSSISTAKMETNNLSTVGHWQLVETLKLIPDDYISSDGTVENNYLYTDGDLAVFYKGAFNVNNKTTYQILQRYATWSLPPQQIEGGDILTMDMTASIGQFDRITINYSGIKRWIHWTNASVSLGQAGKDACLIDNNGVTTAKVATVQIRLLETILGLPQEP